MLHFLLDHSLWLNKHVLFCRTSVRQIAVYSVADLSSVLHKIDLNTSPSILIPYYDGDISVLFVTGRVSTLCSNKNVQESTDISDFWHNKKSHLCVVEPVTTPEKCYHCTLWNATLMHLIKFALLPSTRSSAIANGPCDASCQLKSCRLPRNSAVRQVLNKSKLWSWRVKVGRCVVNMCTQLWCVRVAFIVL